MYHRLLNHLDDETVYNTLVEGHTTVRKVCHLVKRVEADVSFDGAGFALSDGFDLDNMMKV
jgi:hypothetical protein